MQVLRSKFGKNVAVAIQLNTMKSQLGEKLVFTGYTSKYSLDIIALLNLGELYLKI